MDLTLEMAVLTLAVLWDIMPGGSKRFHPVVGIGKLVSLAERWAPREGRVMPFLYGTVMALGLPGAMAVMTYLLVFYLRLASPIAYVIVGGYLLKSTFAVRELGQTALRVCHDVEKQRWPEANAELKSLVSRDTTKLPPHLLVSATVESVAENTADSFVAPWLAFSLFGLPGAIAYRTINTLDSMIGYHGGYEYLGKTSARLDDIVNFIPARLTAILIVITASLRGLSARRAWQTMWQEHGNTESPNAGWTMSAMAGALGVELQKLEHYKLGTPLHPIGTGDVAEAVKVMYGVAVTALFLSLGIMVMRYVFV